jgi:hypothetical protein
METPKEHGKEHAKTYFRKTYPKYYIGSRLEENVFFRRIPVY